MVMTDTGTIVVMETTVVAEEGLMAEDMAVEEGGEEEGPEGMEDQMMEEMIHLSLDHVLEGMKRTAGNPGKMTGQ